MLANRVGLRKRQVAAGSVSCEQNAKKLTLRFTAKAKRKLADRRRLELRLVVTLASGPSKTKTLRLKA